MLCDECRDFSDIFSETAEISHRQVEHQIRLHSSPREPSSDQFPVRVKEWNMAGMLQGNKTAPYPKLASRTGATHLAGLRSSASPARMRAPSFTLAANSKCSGASTMMVEPCSNQPSSSPLRTLASHGNTDGPRLCALRVTSRKC